MCDVQKAKLECWTWTIYQERETERKRERVCYPNKSPAIAQKRKFSINDFFSKCDQIHSFLRHRFGHIY